MECTAEFSAFPLMMCANDVRKQLFPTTVLLLLLLLDLVDVVPDIMGGLIGNF